MLIVVLSRAPILSKAGWRDAAAKTVTTPPFACVSPGWTPQLASAKKADTTASLLITRELDSDVGCLDHSDRGHARFEIQLIDRFAREKGNEAVGTRLDLDLRRDAVLDHA